MPQREKSGILSKNDRKEKDTHPDYKGELMLEGREYWVSGWIKQGQKGPFMSLSVTPKDEQRDTRGGSSQGGRSRSPTERSLKDEIPF